MDFNTYTMDNLDTNLFHGNLNMFSITAAFHFDFIATFGNHFTQMQLTFGNHLDKFYVQCCLQTPSLFCRIWAFKEFANEIVAGRFNQNFM